MKYIEIVENLKSALAVRVLDERAFRRKIGDLLGVSGAIVSRKLSGETYFMAEEITILCEQLNIPVHEVFNSCSDGVAAVTSGFA